MENVVRFFNHGGYGDIHASRSLVKDIVERSGLKCHYHHKYSSYITNDISIQTEPLNIGLSREKRGLESKYGTLYLNTWYGHETHTTLQTLYKNFTPLFNRLKIEQKPLIEYIPTIDYTKYDIDRIDSFIKNKEKLVLICNNDCQSFQAPNFNMSELIMSLALNHKDTIFIISNTQFGKILHKNVVYFNTIIDRPLDMNEISYLSTFCQVIIGRCSGPHSFCFVKDNILREKLFISYNYRWWAYYDFGLSKYSKSVFQNIVPTEKNVLIEETNAAVRRYYEKNKI